MHKTGSIVGKYKILDGFFLNGNKKYKTICVNCGIEGYKWYNSLKTCRFCKPRNRKIIDNGNYLELELTGGEYTKIDKEDYEKIRNFCWYKSLRLSVESRINNELIKLHRLLTNASNGLVVDHINGDTLDNRKDNLRICTNAQNSKNQNKVRGNSKFKGVHWSECRKRFVGRIVNDKKILNKTFKNEIDAAKWYDKKSIDIHGEYGRTNKELLLL